MRADYKRWLVDQGYPDGSVATRMANANKVEKLYGDLGDLFAGGGYQVLIDELTYSTEDERRGRANPSRIQTEGNIRNNLATYKQGVALYRRFLDETQGLLPAAARQDTAFAGFNSVAPDTVVGEEAALQRQRLSLERDMQAELRRDINQLETGLRIMDDGVERYVATGFIDILARDIAGTLVVIELKAGKTEARVIGQTLGYMGDIAAEESGAVRGIIVAHDFDVRTKSAARAVPNLKLMRYAVAFTFQAEG